MDDSLKHYGILGMKWGRRKNRKESKAHFHNRIARKKRNLNPDEKLALNESDTKRYKAEGRKKVLKYATVGIATAATIAIVAPKAKRAAEQKFSGKSFANPEAVKKYGKLKTNSKKLTKQTTKLEKRIAKKSNKIDKRLTNSTNNTLKPTKHELKILSKRVEEEQELKKLKGQLKKTDKEIKTYENRLKKEAKKRGNVIMHYGVKGMKWGRSRRMAKYEKIRKKREDKEKEAKIERRAKGKETDAEFSNRIKKAKKSKRDGYELELSPADAKRQKSLGRKKVLKYAAAGVAAATVATMTYRSIKKSQNPEGFKRNKNSLNVTITNNKNITKSNTKTNTTNNITNNNGLFGKRKKSKDVNDIDDDDTTNSRYGPRKGLLGKRQKLSDGYDDIDTPRVRIFSNKNSGSTRQATATGLTKAMNSARRNRQLTKQRKKSRKLEYKADRKNYDVAKERERVNRYTNRIDKRQSDPNREHDRIYYRQQKITSKKLYKANKRLDRNMKRQSKAISNLNKRNTEAIRYNNRIKRRNRNL